MNQAYTYGALGCIFTLLGFNVSRNRLKYEIGNGPGLISSGKIDMTHDLTKAVRAHGNAAEWIPLQMIMILAHSVIGYYDVNDGWFAWFNLSIVIFRLLLSHGLLYCPTLNKKYWSRFIGASGTFLTTLILAALFFVNI